MKKKFNFINFIMSIIVLFAILFPAIHSYEHLLNEDSVKQKKEINIANKNEFKLSNHSIEKCSICDFKFSTFTTTAFQAFQFQKSVSVIYYNFFCFKIPSTFFKGSLFALRAPPITLK